MLFRSSSVLSTYTGKHEVEDAIGRFHASLAFRREVFDRIGGWPLTKRGDFDQQLIARLTAIPRSSFSTGITRSLRGRSLFYRSPTVELRMLQGIQPVVS